MWLRSILKIPVNGWQGDLSLVAFWPVLRAGNALFLRRLFLHDCTMFLYYDVQKRPRGTPQEFKKILPDALSAEDWFRLHGRYSNRQKTDARA